MPYAPGARPPRCRLVNLASGAVLECLANPTQLTERLAVQWNRPAVPGLPFSPLQYQSTANRQLVGVEFYCAEALARGYPESPDILSFQSFLRELTIPPPGAVGVASVAPPKTLLLWPGVITMECVVTSVELQYKQFGVEGAVLAYTATVTFEEVIEFGGSVVGALAELA